jgi:hypothetical protein
LLGSYTAKSSSEEPVGFGVEIHFHLVFFGVRGRDMRHFICPFFDQRLGASSSALLGSETFFALRVVWSS